MDTIKIEYHIKLPDDKTEHFDLVLDSKKLELVGGVPKDLPDWTKLDYQKCPNCPLSSDSIPHCPAAANIANIVKRFDNIMSYDDISVQVVTKERHISKDTTAQVGVSSLIGLVMATSGCPHTAFFKPMARFHLPFANHEETLFRAASTYLLAQYFRKEAGQKPVLNLEGLNKKYEEIHIVNTSFAERLKAATKTDSSLNAIVKLDMFAQVIPYVIKDAMEKVKYLFADYLEDEGLA